MLVIGHRGAAGLAPENTLDALRAGLAAGADMLEFDIRLTKDRIPILIHDFHTFRTHHQASIISRLTLDELKERTKDKNPIVTLEEILNEFFGVVILNIEIKSRGAGKVAAKLVADKFVHHTDEWDNVIFSSFKGSELFAIRHVSSYANLALLHDQNPFIFIAYQRQLQLTAVGFNRSYINPFALEIAKRAQLFTYVYTVNRPHAALLLAEQGIDGVVSDYPDRILKEITKKRA
jgi:glycerophosphoryl diester phosphodiesterase